MDEISILRDTFDPDAAPSAAAEQRARAALLEPDDRPPAPARRGSRRWRVGLPIAVGAATAAAVVAAFAISNAGGATPAGPTAQRTLQQPQLIPQKKSPPYLKPANAAQYFENAAWTAEQETWVDPKPQQFMYVETLEMRNPPAYEQLHPNGALVPGKARYRDIKKWDRIDGQVKAEVRVGKVEVHKNGDDRQYWIAIPWSQIVKLTTPEAIEEFLVHPEGGAAMDPDAMAGQFVLPPDVKAAIFRYLAQQPGMKVNPDAVNLDGHPAIGLGRVMEGYLSQELLFDKTTYALIGERMIAVKDHVNRGDDGTSYTHKGDLFRQVIYKTKAIVDQPGDTH